MIANEVTALPETVLKSHFAQSAVSRWPGRIARVCGASVALLGLAVLLGWVLGSSATKSVLPGLVEMKANTALCFFLAGAALWLTASPGCKRQQSISTISAFFTISVGLATAFEYMAGLNLGIDELVFQDPRGTGTVQWGLPPGRMALVTAVAFVMAGCSLLLLHGRAALVSQLLACATALTALFSLAAYLWREVGITGSSAYTSLALHTAAGFTVLAVGLVAASRPRGPVAVLMSATRSGALARLLLPAALVVTFGLDGLEAAGLRAGWYGQAYGAAVFSLVNATMLGAIILYVAHRAFLSELATREIERQVHRLNEVLEQRVAERTADLEEVTATLRFQVDERRRAEVAVIQTRAQLMDAIESLDAGLVMYGPDERMVICNAKYKELYAQVAHMMVPGAPYEEILRAFVQAGAVSHTGQSEEEWVGERLDAHRHPGQLHEQWLLGRWIRISDRYTSNGGVVSLRTDITALKQAQETAETANRAKSEFLANMSHEIRTPMNGIIGMTELALDTDLTTEQREYLGMVQSSARSLLTLINDILDFSKIEAGQLELDIAEFELAQSFGGPLRALAIGAQQKGLELACQIAAEVPEALVGDSGRLCQVLVNLVGNAIKFTEHGEVVVRVAEEERAGDAVRLHVSVQDTGIGIPADKQAVIFEAFAQADSTTTRKYGGTGLGLAISVKLVALMGGRLWVESLPGQGSTFHFVVQMSVGRGSVAGRIRIPPPKLEGMPVLVVDDSATNLQILEEVLNRWKMLPTLASGGAAALALLMQAAAEGTPYPLVLVDAHMPDVDGFAVAEQVKATPELARTTLIMLISSGRRGDLERCRELGIAANLLKPVAPGELLEAIVRALYLSQERSGVRKLAAMECLTETERPLRILLAEDNLVNQRLAVGLLTKRGHSVVIAADGKQALAALEQEPFDLMFMDVQMPEMGGYEATAFIREGEKQTGKHLPIIATTAHAMKGDRERCLASGMDGYVSKPILAAELFRAIAEALAGCGQELTVAVNGGEAKGFDPAGSLERVGGDEALLEEIAVLFTAERPGQMQAIQEAITRQDAVLLERAAHAFRGSVSNFCAPAAVAAAGDLETLARAGVLEGACVAYEALETALREMEPAMAKLSEGRPAVPAL